MASSKQQQMKILKSSRTQNATRTEALSPELEMLCRSRKEGKLFEKKAKQVENYYAKYNRFNLFKTVSKNK